MARCNYTQLHNEMIELIAKHTFDKAAAQDPTQVCLACVLEILLERASKSIVMIAKGERNECVDLVAATIMELSERVQNERTAYLNENITTMEPQNVKDKI